MNISTRSPSSHQSRKQTPRAGDPCARCGQKLHQLRLEEDGFVCTRCGWPGLDQREVRHLKLEVSFDVDRFKSSFRMVDSKTGAEVRIRQFSIVGGESGLQLTICLSLGEDLETMKVPIVVTDKIRLPAVSPH